MARNFLTNIDLNKNQLLNAVVQNVAVDPSQGNKGQIIFNTTTNVFKYHNGIKWVTLENTAMSSADIIDAINGQSAKKIQVAKIDGVDNIAQTKADNALAQARTYADGIKTALINSASTDYDTFKEIETAIKRNASALQAISGVTKKFTKEIGDSTALKHSVIHNLNTRDVIVQVSTANAPYEVVEADITIKDNNTIEVETATPVQDNAKLKVVVIG